MKVKELIEKLSKTDQEMDVLIEDRDSVYFDIQNRELKVLRIRDGESVSSRNAPKCVIIAVM